MLSMMRNTSSRTLLLNGALAVVLLAAHAGAGAANVTLDLCATTGIMSTLPGAPSVKVLRYAAGTCPAAPLVTVTPGGPVINVMVGDVVTVNLHNGLSEASGILFQGQTMVPDVTGALPFNGSTYSSKSYTFTATQPGTYLYEAALLPNAQHQVAMGLYGAIVVRPAAPKQAYDDPAAAFDDEAVLVLSEIDPALNNSADPAQFDMRNMAPTYFLINGRPYPATAAISATGGKKLLLRYVNAGIKHHSMALLGLRQNVLAKDASMLPLLSHSVVAETLAPGQTADAIVTMPAVTSESKYALYDAALSLHNSNTPGLGGMLTFVTAGVGAATTGPAASALTLTPATTTGSAPVTINATLTSAASTITRAEYFIDTTGSSGTGLAMSGLFGTATVAASASLSVTQMAALSPGNHTLYVHGQDANSQWGGFKSAVVNLDRVGPATTGLTLSPNPSNGSVDLALGATADERATGNNNIDAAQYTIDGGAPLAMLVSPAGAKVASVTATIAAATVNALGVGDHTVAVSSRDALGNWGVATVITLKKVVAGPSTTVNSIDKSPNNGTLPFNTSLAVVRIMATMVSTGSTVAGAEGFIDSVPAVSVRGFPFVASDGIWNGASETAYADIPLTTVAALSNGNHTLYVRARDLAGNWGPTGSKVLVIDKVAPTVVSVSLTPAAVPIGTANVTLSVSASDIGAGVTGAQYWIDGSATPPANPVVFNGNSAIISTSALPGGIHTVYVRVQDGASNWSAVASATLSVVQAVNDTRAITASTNATQTSDAIAAAGLLANDQPLGVAARSASLVSAPVRTSGTGAGTITLSCPATLGTAAAPSISGNTVCTNGAYRVTMNGVGSSGGTRQASKRGTYQFDYTEKLGGASANAKVTITVN